jgi:hypothetical protein
MFSLQVLGGAIGAAIDFRTYESWDQCGESPGKLPGNPGFRQLQPDELAKASRARERSQLTDLTTTI